MKLNKMKTVWKQIENKNTMKKIKNWKTQAKIRNENKQKVKLKKKIIRQFAATVHKRYLKFKGTNRRCSLLIIHQSLSTEWRTAVFFIKAQLI